MDVITPTIINFISTELVSFESNSFQPRGRISDFI